MRGAENGDHLQPFITPDAVFGMNDEIAGIERAQFQLKLLGGAALRAGTHQAITQDILFGDEREIWRGKTMFQAKNNQPDQFHIQFM